MKSILSINQAKMLSNQLKAAGKSVVLVGGCFDILHVGHIDFLSKAKSTGDFLFVLLEPDATIKKLKGPQRPFHTQKERAIVLTILRMVDSVVIIPRPFSNLDYDNIVKLLQPAIIATTKGDPTINHKKRQAKRLGSRLVFVNRRLKHVYTSRAVEVLQE